MKKLIQSCFLGLPCLYRSIKYGRNHKLGHYTCPNESFRAMVYLGRKHPYLLCFSKSIMVKYLEVKARLKT
ncbi:hypothetical protein [Shivajiella indica]|uniref:Uncharacterized protein n=1 Tax=Shivajiella indica TaxID=872115 RepID=A0ABW5B996_9BACT